MSATLRSKTDAIASSPRAEGQELLDMLSTVSIRRSIGSQREHDEARGAEEVEEDIRVRNLGEYIPLSRPLIAEAPSFTLETLEYVPR